MISCISGERSSGAILMTSPGEILIAESGSDFRLSLANASLNALRADLLCTTANDDVSKEIQEILDHYGDQVPNLGIDIDGFLRAGTVASDIKGSEFAVSLVSIADLLRKHHGHTAIQDDVSIFG